MLAEKLIDEIVQSLDLLLIPDEVLEYLAEEYIKLKGQIKFTFEEYAKIQTLESKVKLFNSKR